MKEVEEERKQSNDGDDGGGEEEEVLEGRKSLYNDESHPKRERDIAVCPFLRQGCTNFHLLRLRMTAGLEVQFLLGHELVYIFSR